MDEVILTDEQHLEKSNLINYESGLEKKRWGILIAAFIYML